MLGFGKSKEHSLLAVCDGMVSDITSVKDDVFSKKILGDGFCQRPDGGIIRSPGEGKVVSVADTGHAYCIELVSGAEVLVHIGIDTVELKGEGFVPRVKEGDKVFPGAVIAEVDIELIENKGYDTTVVTLITNQDKIKELRVISENVKGGVSAAAVYKLK